MKKFVLLVSITILSQILFSQVYVSGDAENYAVGADVVRFKEHSQVPAYIKFKNDYAIHVENALQYTKSFLNAENSDFVLKNMQQNGKNSQTHRYIQTLNGYPIEFSMWNIHVKDGKVTAMNGDIFSNPTASTEFTISEEAALEAALSYFGAEKYMWEDERNEQMIKEMKEDENATYFPKGEKVIAPNNIQFSKSKLRPAYKFEIYASMPHDKKAIYVDAQTGEILFDLPLIHFTTVPATAHTNYSGVQRINTEYNGTNYILRDSSRGKGIFTLNTHNTSDYYSATDYMDNDTLWNTSSNSYGTDAHFATIKTYDYYLNIHGRNSIDGNGHRLQSYVNFDLMGYGYSSNVNAFWNGIYMTYGNGSSYITPLTTVDICGHEITHGLTQHTANLVYQSESGALNEAFSDIFGAAIEFYTVPSLADWTIGEDIGSTMRSLQNPKAYGNPNTYKGTYWESGSADNGGVHTNSGPMYYWFYLLSEGGSGTNDLGNSYTVPSIGIDKAEQIAFRLLTQYLTRTSEYADAYFYGLQAAEDIYGACSPEVQAVGNAFYAIGLIAEPYRSSAFADFTVTSNQSCTAPFKVNFTNTSYNCNSYLWDFGDGSTSTSRNPNHTYTDYGIYTVTLTVNSSDSNCGTDTETRIDYVVVDEGLPCVTIMEANLSKTVQGCSGLIYDTGGPDNIYVTDNTSFLRIHSPGASSIVLNILEFDIEEGDIGSCNYDHLAFFDGNSTSSPIINSTLYCNTTGNPQTIASTGEYITIRLFADPYLTLDGFKIEYYCIDSSSAPIPFFSVDKIFSCDGRIHFTDNSVNNPTSWLWDFGDGTTSTLQNPTHTYTSNGTYSIRLITANSFGEKSSLKLNHITIDMPNTLYTDTTINVCKNETFEIQLNIDSTSLWYSNTNDSAPVFTGNNWTHAPITENTTYYIRDFYEKEEYNVGLTNNTSGGSSFSNASVIHYLVFDAYEHFILKSVSVNASGAKNRTIALRNKKGEIISQQTIYIPNGVSRVELNMEIPVGTDLQLAGLGALDLYRTNTASYVNYPYEIEDVVSIKHSSVAGSEYDYYYYFYDWNIETMSCKSEFTTLNIIADACNSIAENKLFNHVFIAPNPNKGTFEIISSQQIFPCDVEITDVAGKIIYRNENYNDRIISLTNYADGLYFLKLSNDNEKKVIKFVISD